MPLYLVTIKQELEIVLELEADDEQQACDLASSGSGYERSLSIADEYISKVELVEVD